MTDAAAWSYKCGGSVQCHPTDSTTSFLMGMRNNDLMTTFEHVMLGANGALAFGLHKKFGWNVVALAGIAAAAPDWDGLPMMVDMARFESGHRVWGHNLLACLILGFIVASLDVRFRFTDWIVKQLNRLVPSSELNKVDTEEHGNRNQPGSSESSQPVLFWLAWGVIASLSAMTQIPADAVVSGGEGLSHWALKPLWPFSKAEFIYPLVPWGNVGATMIFAGGMICLAKFPRRAQLVATLTLGLVGGFMLSWSRLSGS